MMETKPYIVVKGGRKLVGSVTPDGAKNAVLIQIASACLVNNTSVTIKNVPGISDVADEVEMLREAGLEVSYNQDKIHVKGLARSGAFSDKYASRIRASLAFLGSILGTVGEISLPVPGGDKIGPRPFDIHLDVLNAFDIEHTVEGNFIKAKVTKPLLGCDVYLRFPSVLATVNAILLAAKASGKTSIYNAAKEPEIVDLTNLLSKMGVRIRGVGTNKITVEGGHEIQSCEHEVMPDRLETAALVMALIMSSGKGSVTNTIGEHNRPLVEILRQCGADVTLEADQIIVNDSKISGSFTAETRPYPGLATDIQPFVTLIGLKGDAPSKVTDTIFEHRFAHVDGLRKMGARIDKVDNQISVHPAGKLVSSTVEGGDIRTVVSLINAALMVEGETVIYGVEHLERGHGKYLDKLKAMHADITLFK